MNNNVNTQQPVKQPLKQCKYCKQPIAAKASVCPYCHKSQSSAGLVLILVLLSFLACFLILAFVITPIMQGYQKREQEIKHNDYVVSTEAPTEPTTAEINQLLYDANDIKIYYKGANTDNRRVKLHIYIENNSNRNICVQTRDFSVNGFMVDAIFTPEIASGKKINDTINIYTKELDENNITQMNDVEFYFHIFNWDDWEDKIDTDLIHLEG